MDPITEAIRQALRRVGATVPHLFPFTWAGRITCREFVEFLMDYLSGDLPQAQRSAFERHLASCPHCRAYLQSYEETVKLGKTAFAHPDTPVSPEMPEELVQAILSARATRT